MKPSDTYLTLEEHALETQWKLLQQDPEPPLPALPVEHRLRLESAASRALRRCNPLRRQRLGRCFISELTKWGAETGNQASE